MWRNANKYGHSEERMTAYGLIAVVVMSCYKRRDDYFVETD